MALIKCPECGKEISDKAPACIHCGYPLALELNKAKETPIDTHPENNMTNSDGNTSENANKKYRLILKSVGANPSAIRSALETVGKDYSAVIVNLPHVLKEDVSAEESAKLIELFATAGCNVIAEDNSETEEVLDPEKKYTLTILEHASNRATVANMLIGLRDFDFDTAFSFAGKDNYTILRKADLSEVEPMALKLLDAGAKLQLKDDSGKEHAIPSKWKTDSEKDLPHKSNYKPTSSNTYSSSYYSSDSKVAKCPKCGSTSIQVVKKGFGLGKAAAGAVLLGPVGLLGGVIGSNKTLRVCLNCNHKW